MKLLLILVAVLAVCLLSTACFGYTRLTNIKCRSLDHDLGDFPICELKVLGRGIIAANVHLRFIKKPIKAIKVNYGVLKKLSGYHPFLFNITFDFCHYMKHPRTNPVFSLFHQAILPFSNINTSCPYDHDVIIKNIVLNDAMFAMTPFPKGNYMFKVKISIGADYIFDISSYLDVDIPYR